MNSKTKSTNSLQDNSLVEQGRAIARGMSEETARKERNQAIAEKRKASTLRNAANKLFGINRQGVQD